MTVRELIEKHTKNFPDSHYFDKETLQFFGERISEMRVLKQTVINIDGRECYVLSSYQRNIGKRHYSYFDVNTFEEII